MHISGGLCFNYNKVRVTWTTAHACRGMSQAGSVVFNLGPIAKSFFYERVIVIRAWFMWKCISFFIIQLVQFSHNTIISPGVPYLYIPLYFYKKNINYSALCCTKSNDCHCCFSQLRSNARNYETHPSRSWIYWFLCKTSKGQYVSRLA